MVWYLKDIKWFYVFLKMQVKIIIIGLVFFARYYQFEFYILTFLKPIC